MIDSVARVVVVERGTEELGERGRSLELTRTVPSTMNPCGDTEVTFPEARAKLRATMLVDVDVERLPGPNSPVKPPDVPARQPPLAEGGESVTLAAVTDLIGPVEDWGVPVAETQAPAVTAEALAARVSVKVVADVQLTDTSPVCGFWTSIDVPAMAATVPDADGVVGRRANVEVVAPVPAGVLVPLDPHAAMSVPATRRARHTAGPRRLTRCIRAGTRESRWRPAPAPLGLSELCHLDPVEGVV